MNDSASRFFLSESKTQCDQCRLILVQITTFFNEKNPYK